MLAFLSSSVCCIVCWQQQRVKCGTCWFDSDDDEIERLYKNLDDSFDDDYEEVYGSLVEYTKKVRIT